VKILLDEMHAPSIADALAEEDWDVLAVVAAADLRRISDADLLEHAAAMERALVTENVADFSPLADQWAGEGRAHAGLIFTHPKRFNRASVGYPGNLIGALRVFLADLPIEGASWTWWL
jgi:hypothetical protein